MNCVAVLLGFVILAASGEEQTGETAPKTIVTVKIELGDEKYWAYVDEGEDAAVGAWRFCETFTNPMEPDALERVAKILLAELAEKDYQQPEDFVLRTVGKYIARYKASSKDGFYDEAGQDILRAMVRKGVDDHTKSKLRTHLTQAIRDVPRQRAREKKEQEEEAKLVARKKSEEDAMEEAKKRQAETEEDMRDLITKRMSVEAHGEVLLKVPLNLKMEGKTGKAELILKSGEDPHQAAVHFCLSNKLQGSHVSEMVDILHSRMDDKDKLTLDTTSPDELFKQGKKLLDKAEFVKAAIKLSQALKLKTLAHIEQEMEGMDEADRSIGADHWLDAWKDDVEQDLNECMTQQSHITKFETLMLSGNWSTALETIGSVRAAANNMELLMMMARAHHQLGQWMKVVREAAIIVQGLADYTPWKRGQARMLAVQLGAQAALEIGNIDKALKFYKSVLKYDPDQKEVRSQFRGLKQVQTILKDVDKKLENNRNHGAVDLLEDVLAKIRGMQVNSLLFRSGILLKLCQAQSGMKLHDRAIEACTQAVKIREDVQQGVQSDPTSVAEALKIRAETHTKDNNHDEAVQDLRAARELLSGDAQDQNHQALREAEHRQTDWNENRDHTLVLKLPANLDELDGQRKCRYVKRYYMKLAKKWHPDKNKGNKQRAERKMRELADAKKELFKDYRCKGK